VHAKSADELISFGFSDHSVQSLLSAKCSANCWVQIKNQLHFLADFWSQSEFRTRRKSQQTTDPKSEMTQVSRVCTCDVLVVEKTEPRQHCQTKRSRPWKQQTLLCLWIHERKPLSDDKGQVSLIIPVPLSDDKGQVSLIIPVQILVTWDCGGLRWLWTAYCR